MPTKQPATKAAPKKAAPPPAKARSASAKPAAASTASASAPAGATATATAPPATVTLKILAAEFAAHHSVPKSQADTMLTDIVGMFVQHLKSGDRLRLGGLGILEVKNRPARTGRNPATGAAIEIKASKKISFRAAKELKEAI